MSDEDVVEDEVIAEIIEKAKTPKTKNKKIHTLDEMIESVLDDNERDEKARRHWKGNNFLITDKEYYRKRANIVEEWKDCKIKLVYSKKKNFACAEPGKKQQTYIINIQTPADPCISKKAAVYHELSHVLWDSFKSQSFIILKKWAEDTTAKLVAQNIPDCNKVMTKIPHHIQQEVIQTQLSIKRCIESIYKNCLNGLEDQRTESLTKNVWLATESMFDECRTKCGQEMNMKNMLSPSDHLLAARFNRPELTSKDYIKAMKDVEGKGKKGAIAVMQEIKNLIDEDIGKNLSNLLINMDKILNDAIRIEGEIPAGYGKNPNSISREHKKEARKFDSNSENRSIKDLMQKFRDKTKAESLEEQMQKQSQEAKQTMHSAATFEEKENTKGKFWSGTNHVEVPGEQLNSIDAATISEEIQKSGSKECGKREVNFIMEKIIANAVPKEPAHILTNYPRPTQPAIPNQRIATQFAKTFDRIKETRQFKISENGSEVDIEALLQAKAKGYGEFMVDEVRSNGLMILVTIDGSNSMQSGDCISQARNLVATMFRSVESIPQVKILANVWSSDILGNVGITPVRIEEECNRISTDTIAWSPEIAKFCYPAEKTAKDHTAFVYDNPADPHKYGMMFTPTHEALRYSAKQLEKYSGKKLLIMITDGYPQYHRDGKQFSAQALVNLTMKEYRKAQRYCRNIMCINVSPSAASRENLKRIFKKNYVEFPGMERASEFVLKNFRKTVNATLKR